MKAPQFKILYSKIVCKRGMLLNSMCDKIKQKALRNSYKTKEWNIWGCCFSSFQHITDPLTSILPVIYKGTLFQDWQIMQTTFDTLLHNLSYKITNKFQAFPLVLMKISGCHKTTLTVKIKIQLESTWI